MQAYASSCVVFFWLLLCIYCIYPFSSPGNLTHFHVVRSVCPSVRCRCCFCWWWRCVLLWSRLRSALALCRLGLFGRWLSVPDRGGAASTCALTGFARRALPVASLPSPSLLRLLSSGIQASLCRHGCFSSRLLFLLGARLALLSIVRRPTPSLGHQRPFSTLTANLRTRCTRWVFANLCSH